MATDLHVAVDIIPATSAGGLLSYEDFLGYRGGRLVSRPVKQPVRFIALPSEGGSGYFLKQFRITPRALVTDLWKGRVPLMASTTRERLILGLLDELGIPVMEPVAWGERRFLGIPLSGFLLVREVTGEPFVDCYLRSSPGRRRRLRQLHGVLVGALHRAGLLTKVRPRDLFVTTDDWRDFRACLKVIDRERGAISPKTLGLGKRADQLADIWCKSGIELGIGTPLELRAFFAGYWSGFKGGTRPTPAERGGLREVFRNRARFYLRGHKEIQARISQWA